MWFMKDEAGFSIDEMMNLAPYEYKLFYHMAIKSVKDKMNTQEIQRKELIRLLHG